jgi:hypothetical protein
VDQLTHPLAELVESNDAELRRNVASRLITTALPYSPAADKQRLSRIAAKCHVQGRTAGQYERAICDIGRWLEKFENIIETPVRKRIVRRVLEAAVSVLPENERAGEKLAEIILAYPSLGRSRKKSVPEPAPAPQPAPPAPEVVAEAPKPAVPQVPAALPETTISGSPEHKQWLGEAVRSVISQQSGLIGSVLKYKSEYFAHILAGDPEIRKYLQPVVNGRHVRYKVADPKGIESRLQEFVRQKLNPAPSLLQTVEKVLRVAGVSREKLESRKIHLLTELKDNPEVRKYVVVHGSGKSLRYAVQNPSALEAYLLSFVRARERQKQAPKLYSVIMQTIAENTGAKGTSLESRTNRFWMSKRNNPLLMQYVTKVQNGMRQSYNVTNLEAAKNAILELLGIPSRQTCAQHNELPADSQPVSQAPMTLHKILREEIVSLLVKKHNAEKHDAEQEADYLSKVFGRDAKVSELLPKAKGYSGFRIIKDRERLEQRLGTLINEHISRCGPLSNDELQRTVCIEPKQIGGNKKQTYLELLRSVISFETGVSGQEAYSEAGKWASQFMEDATVRGCIDSSRKSFVKDRVQLEARLHELVRVAYLVGDEQGTELSASKKASADYYCFVRAVFKDNFGIEKIGREYPEEYARKWIMRKDVRQCISGTNVIDAGTLKQIVTSLIVEAQKNCIVGGSVSRADFDGKFFTIEEIRQKMGINDLSPYRRLFGLLGRPMCIRVQGRSPAGYSGENVYNFCIAVAAEMQKSGSA